MRYLLPLLVLGFSAEAVAQVDVNKLIQQKMQEQSKTGQPSGGAGVTMETDNDPIVLNSFIGSFKLEMHSYVPASKAAASQWAEEKSSPMEMDYTSSAQQTLIRTKGKEKGQESFGMLTDHKARLQYMLTQDASGKKMAIKQRKMKVQVNEKEGADEVDVKRMDETREILGYTCTKYVATTKDGVWTGWVAERTKAPFEDMMRQARKGNDHMAENMRRMPGFALEWEWISKDGTQRQVTYVRDLVMDSVDEKAFSLDGYQIQDMTAAFGTR